MQTIPAAELMQNREVIVNLLAGGILEHGSELDGRRGSVLKPFRVIAVLLFLIARVLLLGHNGSGAAGLTGGYHWSSNDDRRICPLQQ